MKTESPEMNNDIAMLPQWYSQLIYDKRDKNIQ